MLLMHTHRVVPSKGQGQTGRSTGGALTAMLLAQVVDTSRRITETSKRLEKIDLLATLLKQLAPQEIEIVVAFLSGRTRQGRIGLGYGALRDASAPAAE